MAYALGAEWYSGPVMMDTTFSSFNPQAVIDLEAARCATSGLTGLRFIPLGSPEVPDV